MNTSIRKLKSYANKALDGRHKTAIFGMLAVMGVTFLGSTLTTALFRNSAPLTLITGNVFSFIIAQIMNVFSAGLSYMYLNMARDREFSYGDLLYLFKHNPDRVLVASLVLSLIELVASIPYYYVNYFVDPGTTFEAQMNWYLLNMLTMLAATLLTMLFTLPFGIAYYILADDTDMGGMEALKLSARLMKGYKFKYVRMMLSFIPWMFLSFFTLYIGLLWLIPYMEMTTVMFYRDIIGELEVQEEAAPTYESLPMDDFNAEA